MPKIVYTNESGREEVIGQERRKGALALVVATLLLGIIGGIVGVYLIVKSPTLRNALIGKTSDSSIIAEPTKQKIVLEESSQFIDVAKKASPSVVSITTKQNMVNLFGQVVTAEGGGTGFIITTDGLIVTNKHVISDQNTSYTVITAEGKSYAATIQALDPLQDLAILKIQANGLPVLDFGDSDALKVGQWVMAIGNALGQFENTVTTGVISAKQRSIKASNQSGGSTEQLTGLLQTDAAINEGNSGGPLMNLSGQVIGVNTAVASKSVAEGIGFAIPINAVKRSIDQVKRTGKITSPYLGVRYLDLTPALAKLNQLKVSNGALVIRDQQGGLAVMPGSPADKAGLKEGDVITEINGTKINENNTLKTILAQLDVGQTVDIVYYRGSDQKTAKATLEQTK